MKMEKQKVGISNWWKSASEKRSDYVNSEDYQKETEDERQERLQEIYRDNDLEQDVLDNAMNKDTIQEQQGLVIDPMDEEEGYYDYEEMDEEAEESMYEEPDYQDTSNE